MKDLMRLIISRSEIDMVQIKKIYNKLEGTQLEKSIKVYINCAFITNKLTFNLLEIYSFTYSKRIITLI